MLPAILPLIDCVQRAWKPGDERADAVIFVLNSCNHYFKQF